MERACELCKGMALMHCESDQASLCWDCDAKVHSANFLVARHFRYLLCHVCHSQTPWYATGAKLGPTVSICPQCVNGTRYGESGEEEAAEEEMESQVVPWSPPAESSSSSGGEMVVLGKRCKLEGASSSHASDNDYDYSSSDHNIRTPPSDSAAETAEEVASVTDSLPRRKTTPQKIRRTDPGLVGVYGSWILESLIRFHREETGSSAEMPESRTLSNGPEPSI